MLGSESLSGTSCWKMQLKNLSRNCRETYMAFSVRHHGASNLFFWWVWKFWNLWNAKSWHPQQNTTNQLFKIKHDFRHVCKVSASRNQHLDLLESIWQQLFSAQKHMQNCKFGMCIWLICCIQFNLPAGGFNYSLLLGAGCANVWKAAVACVRKSESLKFWESSIKISTYFHSAYRIFVQHQIPCLPKITTSSRLVWQYNLFAHPQTIFEDLFPRSDKCVFFAWHFLVVQ